MHRSLCTSLFPQDKFLEVGAIGSEGVDVLKAVDYRLPG